jgi:hypothetical protein
MKRLAFLLLGLSLASSGSADTTIDADNHYAYGANVGWVDFRGNTTTGAVIGEYVCSGYLYSANVGWINLGTGVPADATHYQNASPLDFGVNNDGAGNLRGFAYGANIGWINFESNGAPKIDLTTGKLSGYAYSANVGWISLSNSLAHVQTDTIAPGLMDTNGLPFAWEYQHFGQPGVDPSADPDGDGMSNLQEYLADTDPLNAGDNLRITSSAFSLGGTNVDLTWTSHPTRSYFIQKTVSLNPPTTWVDSGLAGILGSGASTSEGFGDTNAPMRFYRIQAVRPLSP